MIEPKNELIPVLEQIERDKGIKKEEILKMIEQALVSAYKKHSGRMVNIEATIDPQTAAVSAVMIKKVVEQVTDGDLEISLAEARRVSPQAQLEEELRIPVETEDFSRIAAQKAKQVIIQKIRETERQSMYDEYKGKEGHLLNGAVHRFVERNVIVDLGKVEGILPVREQVRREHFSAGERIRIMVLKVEKGTRGPKILLSRAHPLLVQRLFEQEVPEVYEKTVEVMGVVREPGFRSKVAVRSHNPKVDPVGACVGIKGSRVRPIIDELRGERIDLIGWSPDTPKYIASSLSPARAATVTIVNEAEKKAEVVVTDDMLSLAIGKNGQNARLAAKLTGWHIDISSEGQKREAAQERVAASTEELSQLDGVGPKTAETLAKGGWGSLDPLARAKPEDLTVLQGIGVKTAKRIIESAKEFLEARQKEAKPEKQKDAKENS